MNQPKKAWRPNIIYDVLFPEVSQQLLNVVIFLSLIPAYEIGLASTKSASGIIMACGLVLAITIQWLTWVLLTTAVEWLQLSLPHVFQQGLVGVYMNHVWMFRERNWIVFLLHGTPMFTNFAEMMGAQVDGDIWYFGDTLYEYRRLHFCGSTIIDRSHVTGHYLDGNGLVYDDTHVSGILHPGCYANAGAMVAGPECGPWKLFMRATDSKMTFGKPPHFGDSTCHDMTDEDLHFAGKVYEV